MPDCQLEYGEFRQALRLAALRTLSSRAGQMDKGISFDKSPGWVTGFNWDVIGACAERYIYKSFGLTWDGGTVDTFHTKPDVMIDGVCVQVRGSFNTEARLIFRPKRDQEADLYCLVVGEPPRQRLAGFIRGSDCMNKQWHSVLRSGGIATYNVPQRALKTWDQCMGTEP